MKKTILILAITLLSNAIINAQNSSQNNAIKTALLEYIEAGDKNNANSLEKLLHINFRVALFDSNKQATSILDRKTYITFIDTKKFGGYKRTPVFHNITNIGANMSTVNVTLTSPGKPTLKNFYSLVKEKDTWKVLQDYVTLIK